MPARLVEDPDLGAGSVNHGHRAVRETTYATDETEPVRLVVLVVADLEDRLRPERRKKGPVDDAWRLSR